MKKTKLILSLLVFLGACFCAQAQFSGTGNGTVASPYQITNATQLNEMRNYLGDAGSNTHFQLMNDIDLGSFITAQYPTLGWEPIGNNPDESETSQAFKGFLHGGDFTISNLWINREMANYVGLFGSIINGGVDHLTITLASTGIKGAENVGILAGSVEGTNLTDNETSGTIYATAYVGGMVGFVKANSTVTNNTATITINSLGGYVGGLVGQTAASILNCTTSGNINSQGDNVGGLVGYAEATITNSSSSVNVDHKGDFFTGNFLGGLVGVANFTITNCSASGPVHGTNVIGGLIGNSFAPTINSHATGAVSGNAYVGGLAGNSDAVTNSYATGSATSYKDLVGGLAAQSYGPIDRSYAEGAVSGAKSVGGLVGVSYYSITHSFASGNVTGTTPEVAPEGGFIDIGGLVGHSFGEITNCYATGDIYGPLDSMYLGGLIGFSTGDVTNCYASGRIYGEAFGMVGGLVGDAWANIVNSVAANPSIQISETGNLARVNRFAGYNEFDATITGAYALETMTINGVGGTTGTEDNYQGLNKSALQLQTQVNYNTNLTWNFDTIWAIREGHGYPYFGYKINLRSIISSSVNNENFGTISPAGDIAVADGSDKSYEIMPAEGYEIESVLVDGVNVGTELTYDFSNILANHSILVNFRLIDLGTGNQDLVGLKAYPNPVKAVLTISYKEEISNIEVFNLVGQQVTSKVVNAKETQLDMSNLTNGTYFVKVTSDSKVKTVKIVK